MAWCKTAITLCSPSICFAINYWAKICYKFDIYNYQLKLKFHQIQNIQIQNRSWPGQVILLIIELLTTSGDMVNMNISKEKAVTNHNCHGNKHIPIDLHDDVIKWKHFARYWPFVRGIHRWPVNSPHKGQWRGALKFSVICVWINGWADNRKTGDLRRYLPIMTSL